MAKMALEVEVEAKAFQWRDVTTTTPLANVIVEIKTRQVIPSRMADPPRTGWSCM
jgi:hypothetical protein